jgi:glyoxylase-like metal-dependent hydrolase (beta-lactamase superfamily II)/rhodanese-related sulfurtransferase
VLLQQFYLKCLAHASYVIGDEASGIAAVVDPQRDVAQYLDYAVEHGLRIAHVFLTHLHADFIAGHIELRERTGAAIYLGRAAQTEYPRVALADGQIIEFGCVRILIRETPGHTPESVSLVVYDAEVSDVVPQAVLTGDTLFIGDVGRPDLMAAPGASAQDLGRQLYASLRGKLLTLPDSTLVYPAHGAGSLCGKALSQETVSTIGEQRRSNYALQPMSEAAFIGMVTADQPDAPSYFAYDAALNARERPALDPSLEREVRPLSLSQVLEARAAGAQLLDTREAAEFAAAHLPGSVNIGLGGQYATWAGTVLDRDVPIVLVTEPGAETESAMRLGRIGFDRVIGYLEGGLSAAGARPDLVVQTERLSPDVAAARLASASPPLVVDVRAPGERAAMRIPGSLHLPLNHLREQLAQLAADRPLLIHCAGGYRSSIAASLLQRERVGGVGEIAGGITAWNALGLPVEGSAICLTGQTTPAGPAPPRSDR